MVKISNTGFWESADLHLSHAYSKPLVDWIINYLKDQKDKQIYDFGCGRGQYLEQLYNAGFTKLLGFDGVVPEQKLFENIKAQDLTIPFSVEEKGNCLFLEVAEHIPSQYEKTLLDNISNACCGKLIMSWAVRGQGGNGHVSCLNNHEAIERMANKGFIYLEQDTLSARKNIIADKLDIENGDLPWFKDTTLIFKKD
jgi:SAM-dependent methyltransferase